MRVMSSRWTRAPPLRSYACKHWRKSLSGVCAACVENRVIHKALRLCDLPNVVRPPISYYPTCHNVWAEPAVVAWLRLDVRRGSRCARRGVKRCRRVSSSVAIATGRRVLLGSVPTWRYRLALGCCVRRSTGVRVAGCMCRRAWASCCVTALDVRRCRMSNGAG